MSARGTPPVAPVRRGLARTDVVDVTPQDWIEALRAVAPRAVVLDVEPLIVPWSAGVSSVAAAASHVERQVADVTSVEVLAFVTNSARPRPVGVDALWRTRAGKPRGAAALRATHPGPWAVVGDQILTDGLLARRLDGTFLHLVDQAARRSSPWWPRAQAVLGLAVERMLFTRSATS